MSIEVYIYKKILKTVQRKIGGIIYELEISCILKFIDLILKRKLNV